MLDVMQTGQLYDRYYVFKYLQIQNGMFTMYNPNGHFTRLTDSNTLLMPNMKSVHSRQSVRWREVLC